MIFYKLKLVLKNLRIKKIIYSIFLFFIKLFIILVYLFVGLIDFEIINNFLNVYALSENDTESDDEKKENKTKKNFYIYFFIFGVLILFFFYLYYKTSNISDLPIIENQPNIIKEEIPVIEKTVQSNNENIINNPNNKDTIKALEKIINETISSETIDEITESIKNNKDGIQDKLKELLDQLNKTK